MTKLCIKILDIEKVFIYENNVAILTLLRQGKGKKVQKVIKINTFRILFHSIPRMALKKRTVLMNTLQ